MYSRGRIVLPLVMGLCLTSIAAAQQLTKFNSRAYTIYTDLAPDEAREIAKHMDGVFTEYTRRLAKAGFDANRRTELPLYLFRSQTGYESFLASKGVNAQNTGGMFFIMPSAQGLATFTGGQSRSQMYHTLQHEGFHQFAYQRISEELPIWANEGLAEYFGDALLVKGRFVLGQVDHLRLASVQQAVRDSKAIPFATMVNITPREWSMNVSTGSPLGHLQYAQAWSMIHFLVHAKPAYQQAFMRYLTNVHRGVPSGRAFEQAFGASDYRPFEDAWRQYMLDLQPDPLTTASQRLTFLAQGLKMLRSRNQSVDSLDALKGALQAVNFRVRQISQDSICEYSAADEANFQPPTDPTTPGKAEIKLTANRNADLPPQITITGLKALVRLDWQLDDQGQPVEQITFE